MAKFEQGTRDLMDAVAAATKKGVTTVIGECTVINVIFILCFVYYLICIEMLIFLSSCSILLHSE